jgi:hypothetical protein
LGDLKEVKMEFEAKTGGYVKNLSRFKGRRELEKEGNAFEFHNFYYFEFDLFWDRDECFGEVGGYCGV